MTAFFFSAAIADCAPDRLKNAVTLSTSETDRFFPPIINRVLKIHPTHFYLLNISAISAILFRSASSNFISQIIVGAKQPGQNKSSRI
jgi:hypothetical protein